MIGVASPVFCFAPFVQTMELISRHFDLWEVLVEGEHGVEDIRSEAEAAIESYDMTLQVHAPMSDVNIGSVYEPMRRAAVNEIGKVLSFCNDIGVKAVTVHPGFIQGIAFLRKEAVKECTHRSLLELAPMAEDADVTLMLENMPTGINATCTTAEELVDVLDGTGLDICFDLGHANTADQVDAFLMHRLRFRNIHVHNNDGTWDQHKVIDQGTAPLEKVVRAIRDGYEGNWIIESLNLEDGVRSKPILERLLE